MSENYLITGLAGSGKTTLCGVFRSHGFKTHDIDDGFACWQNPDTGEKVEPDTNASAEWHDKYHWMLDRQKINVETEKSTDSNLPKIFFGFTADLSENADLFDRIFLLEYPDDQTIRDRASTRSNPHAYGKKAVELARIIADREPVQKKFRDLGAITIDCTLTTRAIARIILSDIKS